MDLERRERSEKRGTDRGGVERGGKGVGSEIEGKKKGEGKRTPSRGGAAKKITARCIFEPACEDELRQQSRKNGTKK